MHRSTFLLLALGTSLFAVPSVADPEGEAARHLPVLTLPPVVPKVVMPSRVPVVIAADPNWGRAVLAERIPAVLYQVADREVSPGVWVDATVRRGPIDFRVRADGVTGLVSADVDLAVRSKLGKMVLRLGQCHTTIDSELDLSLRLASDGTLPLPTARAVLRAPCHLSGFDVTPLIRYEVDRRLDAAREQMARHLGEANSVLKGIQSELLRHFFQASVGCARFTPSKLLQTPLVVEDGMVSSRLVAEGEVTNDCHASSRQQVIIEPLVGSAAFDMAWSTRLPLTDLQELLAKALTERGTSGKVTSIRAVRVDDSDQLALYLHTPKARGWVFARPTVLANALTFRSVTAQRADLLQALGPVLEGVALPIDTASSETLAHQVVVAANELNQVYGYTPDLRTRYQIREAELRMTAEVVVDREALIIVVRRRAP